MTFLQFIVKKEGIFRKLEEAAFEFNDKVKGALFLKGLSRKKFNNFLLSFSLNDGKDSYSVVNVKSKMLKEGRKETVRAKNETDSEAEEEKVKAFRVDYKNKNIRQGQDHRKSDNMSKEEFEKRNVECYYCHEKGHIAKYCPILIKKNQRQESTRNPSKENQRKGARQANYEEEEETQNTREESENTSGSAAKVVKFRALQAKKKATPLPRDGIFEWVGDSGATHYMTPYKEILSDLNEEVIGTVELADREIVEAKGQGKITMLLAEEFGGWKIELKDVVYVPDLDSNLISIIQLDLKGMEIKIKKGTLSVIDPRDKSELFSMINAHGDAYLLGWNGYEVNGKKFMRNGNQEGPKQAEIPKSRARRAVLWHDRLGHMTNLPNICDGVRGPNHCDVCIQGKMKRKKFPVSDSRAENVLDLVHSDIAGKISPRTQGKNQYVLTFLDDHSRFSDLYLMKKKSETLPHFETCGKSGKFSREKTKMYTE